MWKGPEWTRAWLITLCAAALGVCGWFAFYVVSQNQSHEVALLKPLTNSPFSLAFSGEVDYEERSLASGEKHSVSNFEGRFRVTPQAHFNGTLLKLRIESFALNSPQGKRLFSFDLGEDLSIRYHFSELLSQPEREALIQAFRINLENTSAAHDQSLFHYPLQLFVNYSGGIEEIVLPPAIRDPIYDKLMQSLIAPVALELLNRPEKLPPLLDGSVLTSFWTTTGFFFQPIQFQHRTLREDGTRIRVSTQSRLLPASLGEDRLPAENSWAIEWEYDRAQRQITELHLSTRHLVAKDLMGATEFGLAKVRLDIVLGSAEL